MKILLIGQAGSSHFRQLNESFEAEYIPFPNGRDEDIPKKIDIAITHDEFYFLSALTIAKLRELNVPTLHIADGILEWRNTWNQEKINKTSRGGMPLFQPILSNKIACLGRSQARILESWGNLGKCEIVGAPRLDPMLEIQSRPLSDTGPVRILVVTARTPFFNEGERTKVLASLRDLKAWFENNSNLGGRDLIPAWRLTKGLDREIGLSRSETAGGESDLVTALEEADAVITTPSTVMLEAMLMRRPVALLDYTNSPHYVPAAWRITAPHHIEETIRDLVKPPPARMLFQDTVLHDSLECRTPATPRLIILIEEMVRISRECKREGRELCYPDRILRDPQGDHHLPEEAFDMKSLYPEHPVFGNMKVLELQAELGHLHNRLENAFRESQEIDRIRHYGSGRLVARLAQTFPYPRRMWRSIQFWIKDRKTKT